MKNKNLLILFTTFFKIGLFTFGGGYSMLTFIEKEITEKHKFVTYEELLDVFSIAECTPGPISINCATFIGYKIAGFLGAIISTIAISIPSFAIILFISIFYNYLKEFKLILNFLDGIKVGVIVLLINSVIKINSKCKKTRFHFPTIVLILVLSLLFNISSILILLTSILIYLLIFIFRKKEIDI